MNRRDFLKNTAFASAGTLMIPQFLKAHESRINRDFNGKVLVVIQLSGGNDGLNTVVPYRNDIYYRERPTLAIERSKVLSLSDEIGLNPALEAIRTLYDDGRVRILNNVGYPNPDRSHFRSMDIWQTASDSNKFLTTGWLGRYLDATCSTNDNNAHRILEIDDTLSLALKGKTFNGMAMLDPEKLYRQTKNGISSKLSYAAAGSATENQVGYLYKTLAETTSSADYLFDKTNSKKGSFTYPNTELGKSLKVVSDLINTGVDTSVYYSSIAGFDTHVGQRGAQDRALKLYAEAVSAFVNDLKQSGNLDRTMILTFSEFGRRIKQNASGGTDHGTANNAFIIGGKPRNSAIYNEAPNLVDIDGGDLRYSIDFRNIYASLLTDWLEVDHTKIVGSKFKVMSGLCS